MYQLQEKELYTILNNFENKLFKSEKIKFERNQTWRKNNLKNVPGIYALFEDNNLKYIGETGDLLKRMSDITRTVNHSFRKQIGAKMFNGVKSTKKFEEKVENLIDDFFDNSLYIRFVEVNFGRLEIETYLVDKYQNDIINSKKIRKLKYDYELLQEIEKASS